MNNCDLYVGETSIVIGALNKIAGHYQASKKYIALPRGVVTEELGVAILSMLEAQDIFENAIQAGIESPEQRKSETLLFLNRFSVGSWKHLYRDYYSLSVKKDESEVIVIPTKHLPKGGYADETAQAVRSPIDPESIGEAVLEALKYCA